MRTLMISDEIDQEFSNWWRDRTRWDLLLTDDMREIAALAYASGREQGQHDAKELLINRLRAMREDQKSARRESQELSEKISAIEDILRR